MPTAPSPAQSEASRANGARSAGPATDAGKARSGHERRPPRPVRADLLPARRRGPGRVRRGTRRSGWPSGRRATCTSTRRPLAAIRGMWREIRADRLEAQVLGDLFAAGRIGDEAERAVAQDRAFKALNTLLRYKARLDRERATPATRWPPCAPAAWPRRVPRHRRSRPRPPPHRGPTHPSPRARPWPPCRQRRPRPDRTNPRARPSTATSAAPWPPWSAAAPPEPPLDHPYRAAPAEMSPVRPCPAVRGTSSAPRRQQPSPPPHTSHPRRHHPAAHARRSPRRNRRGGARPCRSGCSAGA